MRSPGSIPAVCARLRSISITGLAKGAAMDEPDLQPRFRHLDDADVPWQEVKRQRNSDGSTSSVWEKWFAFSAEPQYLSLYAKYDPGMIVRRHGHLSPHVVFVIDGELVIGGRSCPAGSHIELPSGAAFGPIRSGESGAFLFEVMMGDPRSWGDQPGRPRREPAGWCRSGAEGEDGGSFQRWDWGVGWPP